MSDLHTTLDTNPKLSETSSNEPIKKRPGPKSKKQTFTTNQEVAKPQTILKKKMTPEQEQAREDAIALSAQINMLDQEVVKAKMLNEQFIETTEEVLAHFNGGTVPATGIMYKGLLLVLPGTYESITEKQDQSIYQINHPNEKGFKIYTTLKK